VIYFKFAIDFSSSVEGKGLLSDFFISGIAAFIFLQKD
jgi:hypothetical protein